MSAGGVVRRGVGVLGELLVTAGVLVLLFVAWQLWFTDLTSGRAQAATVDALQHDWAREAPAAPGVTDVPAAPQLTTAPPTGAAFAVVRVPRFGAGYAVPAVEGTGSEELAGGFGHYPGTALPGVVGNFALAGHRVTYGKPLNRIAELVDGDPVVVETATQWFVYRVRSHEVVAPSRVSVIAPVPDRPGEAATRAWLTLTACHPMHSARQRYVVHAELESTTPRADGPPAALGEVR